MHLCFGVGGGEEGLDERKMTRQAVQRRKTLANNGDVEVTI